MARARAAPAAPRPGASRAADAVDTADAGTAGTSARPLVAGRWGTGLLGVMVVLLVAMVGLPFAPATGDLGLLHALWFTSGCSFWFLIFLGVVVLAVRRRRVAGGWRSVPVVVGFAVVCVIALAFGAVAGWSGTLLAVDLARGTSTVAGVRCTRVDDGGPGARFDDVVVVLPDGTTTSSDLSFALRTETDRRLRSLCGTEATFTMEYWPATATVRRVRAD